MTSYTHAGALPRHQYCFIEPNAIGEHGWLPCVWFGIASHPGRTWGCHVLLECGAVYRNVPIHQLASRPSASAPWTAKDAQTWDCYGWQFSTIEYTYLTAAKSRVKLQSGANMEGKYLFTVVPVDDAFSTVPEQAKEFYVVGLENGRYTAQPTNHVLVEERSFTRDLAWPDFLRSQTAVHSAED